MTGPSNIPTGRAIVRAVRASLRLTGSSLELLTVSQLFAVKSELRQTLAIVNGQIQATHPSNDQQLVIDLSDWDSASEENGERDGNVPGANEQQEDPLPVPGPYPVSPPEMDELPEYWYVVERGTEVGIMADSASSARAVAGVPDGHQVRVKTWYEAAELYNSLWHNGLIVRVKA